MGLRIHAITVSVDYAPQLARSIARWVSGLTSLIVVTSHADDATAALATAHGAGLLRTGAFYEEGAFFNKGRAIQQARELLPAEDWHLLIDADVVPPEDWQAWIEAQSPVSGVLHGARRVHEDGTPINDRELAGFFQLWHSSDPRGAAPVAVNFIHAGNYDSLFMQRWPVQMQRILDLDLLHLGELGQNWCGVGNRDAMATIRAMRRRGRSWKRETVK